MRAMLPFKSVLTRGTPSGAHGRNITARLTHLLLALVLLLGPFLHAHLEASPIEGFHLNGLAALSAETPDSETDSVSVGAYSLMPDAASVLGALLALMWLHALCWAPRRSAVRPARQPRLQPSVRAWHEPGRPPPALAPPAA